MRSGRLPKRERVRLQQRQEMLAAACDLFSEKGYHRVSMREIAEKAEFAVGTLYKFFNNKEDLYKALLLEQCDRFENAIIRAMEGSEDEIDKLRHYVRIKGEELRENLPSIRLFLAERNGASFNLEAGLDSAVRKRHYALLERLAAIFESAINKNRFKKTAPPFGLALALDSVIDAFFLLRQDIPEHHFDPKFPEAILDVFFNGLAIREPCQSFTAESEAS